MEKGVIDVSLKMRREPWFKGEGFLCTFSVTLVTWFVSLLVCLGGEGDGGWREDIRALRFRYNDEKVARDPIRTPR